jgi:DNA invertase Pin-like site-specific DNA recombinase
MTPKPRKTGATIRAIAYVRVSSQKQADSGLSLESQAQKVRAMATVHDVTLDDVLIDAAESAASLDRPQVQELLRRVRAREVDAVYIAKLDRITRSVRDLDELLTTFRKYAVALVSVSESLDTSTAAGRMVVNMLGVVGQWEREAIAERTADALHAKRKRGEIYGTIPYGFRLADNGNQLEAHDGERRILATMRELRDGCGVTWREMAEQLNRDGFTTRRGTPWTLHVARSAYFTARRNE